jgi:hypothetical protein
MKKYILPLLFLLFIAKGYAQTFTPSTWKKGEKNLIHLGIGLEYGGIVEGGYEKRISKKGHPHFLYLKQTFPMGSKVFDDFKTEIGYSSWVTYKNFGANVSLSGIFRRLEMEKVRLLNFGSQVTVSLGYYKPKFFISAEGGFDKAIVTHFKHSESFRSSVFRDGWYNPSTGGNLHAGITTGFLSKKTDYILAIGRIVAQDWQTDPLIPFYAKFSIAKRW